MAGLCAADLGQLDLDHSQPAQEHAAIVAVPRFLRGISPSCDVSFWDEPERGRAAVERRHQWNQFTSDRVHQVPALPHRTHHAEISVHRHVLGLTQTNVSRARRGKAVDGVCRHGGTTPYSRWSGNGTRRHRKEAGKGVGFRGQGRKVHQRYFGQILDICGRHHSFCVRHHRSADDGLQNSLHGAFSHLCSHIPGNLFLLKSHLKTLLIDFSTHAVFLHSLAQVHVRLLAFGHRLFDVHFGARLHVSIPKNCTIL